MRCLFVIDNLGSGGAQRQIVSLALGLVSRGHQVEFFVYHPQDFFEAALRAAAIPVHRVRKQAAYDPRVLLELQRVLSRARVDVVLSYLKTPSVYAELVRWPRRRPALVVSEGTRTDLQRGMRNRWWRLAQLHRLADHVVFNSHHERENWEATFAWIRPKSSTIYNGVDLKLFSPVPSRTEADPVRRLLAVGSVSPDKNGLCLVEALAVLRDKTGLRPQVDWVGSHQLGLRHRVDYIARMNARIDSLQIREQWTWLHERSDMTDLYRSHDALVHPATVEGLPNVVCEALASGCPVLASRCHDHPLLVQEGTSGFLFDPHDPSELAATLERFLRLDAERRADLGLQGRRYAERHLSLELLVTAHEELFVSLLGRCGKPGSQCAPAESRRTERASS